MPASLIPSLIVYCFVTVITPGPANLCTFAAAITYGKKKALSQWRGLFAGFWIIALAASVVVWFFGTLLSEYVKVMTWIGAAYIMWLAYHMLRSNGVGEAHADAHCNFFTGLFINLTNPKVIIYCITVLTTFVLPYADSYTDVLKVAVLLPFTGPVANFVWLFAGSTLQKFFRNYQKQANVVMALSLALCAVSIVVAL